MNSNKPNVGGQAIIEGVMMRSPGSLAVAVRRPNGQIVLREDIWHSIWERIGFLRWPFFRGSVIMIEAMINGMQALNFSAREAMTEEELNSDGGGEIGGLGFALTIGVGMLFAIVLFKLLPHLAATYAGKVLVGHPLTVDDVAYHFVDGGVKIAIFIAYIAVIGRAKDIARVFMYHGAEHMAIATFEADEELCVENARNKSTLHPRCGTAFIMVVILVFILVAAVAMPMIPTWAKPLPGEPWYRHLFVVLFKLPLLVPVAGIAYEFNRFAGKRADNWILRPFLWPGLGMQLLTTNQPDDAQLEIALASLKTVLWREEVGSEVPSNEEPLVFEDFEALTEHLAVVDDSAVVS
jgi:uncharacterized protein YqhQ